MVFKANPQELGFRKIKPTREILVVFAVGLLVFSVEDFLLSSQSISAFLLHSLLWTVAFTLVVFARLPLVRKKTRSDHYQLVIGEDEITMNLDYSTLIVRLALKKHIRRGQIKTIVERKSGLTVSKRNRIGTFFLGGVWIPKKLPEYEFLKSLTMGWKSQSGNP